MREFRQFGIEVIGVDGPGADVEVIVVGDAVPAGTRPPRHQPAPQLDRRRGLPPRVPRASSSPTSSRSATSSTRTAACGSRNPLRVFDCKVDGEQGLRAGRAHDRRSPVRGVRGALRRGARRARRGGGGVRARASAGPGTGLLHAHGVRVDLRGARGEQGGHAERRWSVRRPRRGPRRITDARRRVRDGARSRPARDGRRGVRPVRRPGPLGASWSRSATRRASEARAWSHACGSRGVGRRERSRTGR